MVKLTNILQEILTEIGDSQPYSWNYDFVDDDGNFFYSFNTPNNKYSVGVTPQEGGEIYELLFHTEGEMGADTNEHVALRVLATVFDIAKKFVAEQQPEQLIVRPTEEKRERIYGVYALKNLPPGYKSVKFDNTYRWIKK